MSARCEIFSFLAFDELGYTRLVTIMREEGPVALYKGFIPKVLRLAPGGGVLLLVVEATLEVFRKGPSSLLPFTFIHLTFPLFLIDSSWTSLRLDISRSVREKGGWCVNYTSVARERSRYV